MSRFAAKQCVGEPLHVLFRTGDDGIRQALCCFQPDARQLCELLRQKLQRKRIVSSHSYRSKQTRQRNTAGDLAHLCLCGSLYLVHCLVDSADNQILEHLDVLRINDLRLDLPVP